MRYAHPLRSKIDRGRASIADDKSHVKHGNKDCDKCLGLAADEPSTWTEMRSSSERNQRLGHSPSTLLAKCGLPRRPVGTHCWRKAIVAISLGIFKHFLIVMNHCGECHHSCSLFNEIFWLSWLLGIKHEIFPSLPGRKCPVIQT